MSDNNNNLPLALLGVLFVALKLTHVIDWSWWWVTCPFWIGLAIVFGATLVAAIVGGVLLAVAGIVAFFSGRSGKRRR